MYLDTSIELHTLTDGICVNIDRTDIYMLVPYIPEGQTIDEAEAPTQVFLRMGQQLTVRETRETIKSCLAASEWMAEVNETARIQRLNSLGNGETL